MFDKKAWSKQYYQDNIEKYREYSRQYHLDHPEKAKLHTKKYRERHPDRVLESNRRRRKTESYKEWYKKWYPIYSQENKEKIAERGRINKVKHKEKENEKRRILRKTNLKVNLDNRISRAINHSLKGNKKGRHWEDLVGYTLDDLIAHLKETIPEGYTWEDFLNGDLHIDHIIPISVWNYAKPEHTDFKRCWGLYNLRLLPPIENWHKNNKLYKPFQPALRI
jgi:hypothetical protein